MSRPHRVQFEGAIYHVTVRAIEPMFTDAVERERWLAIAAEVTAKHGWVCHAYCQMDNHVHLLVETPTPNLAKGMCELNGRYVRYFNWKNGRRGPLLEKRYGAVPIERESHLLEVTRYIVLNRERARLCAETKDWPWSSFPATAGRAPRPRFLHTEWVLALFDGHVERYAKFVAEGSPAASLAGLLLCQ